MKGNKYMSVQQKDTIGIVYTPSGNFLILQKVNTHVDPPRLVCIGAPAVKEIDWGLENYTYPEPHILHIVGDHVFMEFDQPKQVYFSFSEDKK